jgi:Na+-transporting NADH:ubiquinone oxidoreductase subunit NqrC
MKGSAYTLTYSAILGAVCALLLTGASQLTAPYREANAKAEEIRNILSVLEVPSSPSASSRDLLKLFKARVREETRCDPQKSTTTNSEQGALWQSSRSRTC